VFLFRPLPWEYAVRNLFRRPVRSALTMAGLTTVILLVFVVVGFIRGLEKSLSASGDPNVVLLFALGMGENLEYSSVSGGTADVVERELRGVRQRFGRDYVSAELYQATMITPAGAIEPAMGLVRGVTPSALLVRQQVQIEEGRWPGPGEVMVGPLAAAKMGIDDRLLAVGRKVEMENREWTVSGRFSAGGSVFESEVWCRRDDLQQAMKRQDVSLVAVKLAPGASFPEIDLYCKERPTWSCRPSAKPITTPSCKRTMGPCECWRGWWCCWWGRLASSPGSTPCTGQLSDGCGNWRRCRPSASCGGPFC